MHGAIRLLSYQSKFYRWRPAEAIIDIESKELKFPTKIQLNYGDKAVTCELKNLEFYVEKTESGNILERGQHYVHD